MDELWRHDELSVRALCEALNGRAKKPRAYTTYMTIMVRLHRKGLLERRREGKTDFYRPVHSREEYADLRAQSEVDSLVDSTVPEDDLFAGVRDLDAVSAGECAEA